MRRLPFLRPFAPHALTALALAAMAMASPAAADFRLERELALGSGGTFVLDSDVGSIDIRGTDRADARIVVTARRDDLEERYSFSFEERGADAVVKVDRRGGWTKRLFGSDDRVRFEIEVPRSTDVDLETAGGAIDAQSIEGRVDLHSSGGSIAVGDIDGDVDAHTSGGSMKAHDVRGNAKLDSSGGAIRAEGVGGNLVAKTSGGSIHASVVGGDLVARTSGGSVELRDVAGAVQAHTSGGPVRATFAAGNGSGGSLSSSGGGITAVVDPAVALDIHAHSSGGRVNVGLPITVTGAMRRNTVQGSLNGGGPLLKLSSSGGPIELRPAS